MIAFLLDQTSVPARVVRHEAAARRIRLAIPVMLGDRHLARRVEAIAHAWPGIVDARADARSGRMLLCYAPGAPLLRELRAPGQRPQPDDAPQKPAAIDGAPLRDDWHALSVPEVFAALGTAPTGLSIGEAARRLRRHGVNLAEAGVERSRLAILLDQVANTPMAILAGSFGLSVLLGDLREAAAILVVVGLNAAIGYRIEHQNQRVLASWRRLEAGSTKVIREGAMREVATMELVPGDVILVRAGDVVPADARVIDAHRLSADEAPLTGESEPRPKGASPVPESTPLAERACMLFAGTSVATGHGRAVIVATGAATELARVRALVESSRAPPVPLAARMERLGRRVAAISIGASALAAGAGILHGRPLRAVARSAVALGVAALPEGLPLVTTSALVRSMQRLHDRGLVVRRVAAAEALSGVTVICADKTGTLTRNEMRFEVLEVGGRTLDPAALRVDPRRLFEDPVCTALAAGLLNSDVDVQGNGSGSERLEVAGSSTERALVDAAHAAGLDGAALRAAFPRLELRERAHDVRYVISVHRAPDGGRVAFLKGAPEQVLDLCELEESERERLRARNEALAASGLRVLALAFRPIASEGDERGGYRFLGLAGLRDPLRAGAAEVLERAGRAGIRTLVLTGDQQSTAAAIAEELGLGGEVLLPGDLKGLSSRALSERIAGAAVVARVTPEDKVAIVRALRASGEVVAMAGDGINDAPALKAADVGVAVGARATDLAREVADVVMAGEDLRGILAAVGEGRIVQDNLRRAMRYLFATNLSEVALVLGASLVGAREPLGPMQLLWINLLTDTLPGFALAREPGDPDILDRPPAMPKGALLQRAERRIVLRDALLLAGLGAVGLAIGGPSLAFATLTAAQLSYAFDCRAPRRVHDRARAEADRRFALLVGGAIGLQLLAITVPPLRALLRIRAPPPLLVGGLTAGLALGRLGLGNGEGGVVIRRGRPRPIAREAHA